MLTLIQRIVLQILFCPKGWAIPLENQFCLLSIWKLSSPCQIQDSGHYREF